MASKVSHLRHILRGGKPQFVLMESQFPLGDLIALKMLVTQENLQNSIILKNGIGHDKTTQNCYLGNIEK